MGDSDTVKINNKDFAVLRSKSGKILLDEGGYLLIKNIENNEIFAVPICAQVKSIFKLEKLEYEVMASAATDLSLNDCETDHEGEVDNQKARLGFSQTTTNQTGVSGDRLSSANISVKIEKPDGQQIKIESVSAISDVDGVMLSTAGLPLQGRKLLAPSGSCLQNLLLGVEMVSTGISVPGLQAPVECESNYSSGRMIGKRQQTTEGLECGTSTTNMKRQKLDQSSVSVQDQLPPNALRVWDHEDVRLLLQLFKRNMHRFGNPRENRREVWNSVVMMMTNPELRSYEACTTKFRQLRRTYEELKSYEQRTGEESGWVYKGDMEEIFNWHIMYKEPRFSVGTNTESRPLDSDMKYSDQEDSSDENAVVYFSSKRDRPLQSQSKSDARKEDHFHKLTEAINNLNKTQERANQMLIRKTNLEEKLMSLIEKFLSKN